jgi:hypothetical protein
MFFVFLVSACSPSEDEIWTACVKIRNTAQADQVKRIEILENLGVPPKKLEESARATNLVAKVGDDDMSVCTYRIRDAMK